MASEVFHILLTFVGTFRLFFATKNVLHTSVTITLYIIWCRGPMASCFWWRLAVHRRGAHISGQCPHCGQHTDPLAEKILVLGSHLHLKRDQPVFYIWVSMHRKSIIYKEPTRCNFGQYCFLLTTASTLYMFRTLSVPIIRSTKNCSNSHWCVSWVRMMYIQ